MHFCVCSLRFVKSLRSFFPVSIYCEQFVLPTNLMSVAHVYVYQCSGRVQREIDLNSWIVWTICECVVYVCVRMFECGFTAININSGQYQFAHIHHAYQKARKWSWRETTRECEMEKITVFQISHLSSARFGFFPVLLSLRICLKSSSIIGHTLFYNFQLHTIHAYTCCFHPMEWRDIKNMHLQLWFCILPEMWYKTNGLVVSAHFLLLLSPSLSISRFVFFCLECICCT